jgi:hypothetical protein
MHLDHDGLSAVLVRDGYLQEHETEIEYVSRSGRFMFAKYKGGQLFVGTMIEQDDRDLWVMGMVDSAENARLLFTDIDERAPDFVIIWE